METSLLPPVHQQTLSLSPPQRSRRSGQVSLR
uniref:Uncharacterized protein n=1 Tax=Parascaris equorum TaxID=6256 RepID=A0A914RPN7_PAREQ